jgi:hypothetical protein
LQLEGWWSALWKQICLSVVAGGIFTWATAGLWEAVDVKLNLWVYLSALLLGGSVLFWTWARWKTRTKILTVVFVCVAACVCCVGLIGDGSRTVTPTVSPSSIALYRDGWPIQTEVIIENPNDFSVSDVIVHLLIEGAGVLPSSVQIGFDLDTVPNPHFDPYPIAARINCLDAPDPNSVILVLLKMEPRSSRALLIGGTASSNSSAQISISRFSKRNNEMMVAIYKNPTNGDWTSAFKVLMPDIKCSGDLEYMDVLFLGKTNVTIHEQIRAK